MSDHRDAARRIVADLGRGRAAELLELFDHPDLGALIRDDPRNAADEARVLNALQLVSDMHIALDEISWTDETMIRDEKLAEALRRDLERDT